MNRMVSFLKRKKKYVIAISIVLVTALSYRFVEDYYFEVSKNLDIFSTVYRDVNIYYVDSLQPGSLMRKGIDAMLKSLDPYSIYVPESDLEDYRMTHVSAEYGGIGALVQNRNGEIEISEVYEGFPAQKADIRPGDRLLSVNGVSIGTKKVDDVTDYLKGAKGSKVTVTLKREGEAKPLEKTLYRDEVKFKNVPYTGMINENTGYIRLNQFLENASEEVKDALTRLKGNPNMKYLVFDLRGNGGGLLKEAVDIVNLFIDRGQRIVSQKGKIKEMNAEYVANKMAVDPQIPIVILVDKSSASASEIVTGAVQELDRGVIVGQRTFGKGLVQQTYDLSYNTLLKITVAKYYTPSGRCIQALDYAHRMDDGRTVHRADSTIKEFKTKAGRSVFDGSGIYPDVYLEPVIMSNVSQALIQNLHHFDYANKYFREHPGIGAAKDFRLTDEEFNQFVEYLKGKKYDYTNKSERKLEELRRAADKEKDYDKLAAQFNEMKQKMNEVKKQDLVNHREEIKGLLEQEIVSRYYFQTGALENNFRTDKELKKALEILSDSKLYASILAGEGTYKVIGKPGTTDHNLTGSETEDWPDRN